MAKTWGLSTEEISHEFWAGELGKEQIMEAATLRSSDFTQEGCDADFVVVVVCCVRKITLIAVGRWKGWGKICVRVKVLEIVIHEE